MHNELPQFHWKPQNGPKKRIKKSMLRTIIEFLLFIVWLICTGFAGYYLGYDETSIDCPEVLTTIANPPNPTIRSQIETKPVISTPNVQCMNEVSALSKPPPLFKEGGYTLQELESLWECSHAVGNLTELNAKMLPTDLHMEKTKWKSIITVEPKPFFEKYLSQYPGDTRALQPVIVFSHKPLNSFDELSDVCKVLDIAVVPDKPGTCVAVTETYHDVASYHMLHADKQVDGSFSLTSNFIDGRILPDETAYAAARNLILEFFKHQEAVQSAMKNIPKFSKGKVVVASLVDDVIDTELFLNSYQSALKHGISKGKFCIFTTSKQVSEDLSKTGIKIVFLPMLTDVAIHLSPKLRRYFLQTWLAFAAANSLAKVLWQTPSTIWFERPDNLVHAFPIVETLWIFKGRRDPRSAPFFISFDFMIIHGVERPVHLLHELIMHFDLIMAWDSLDAVTAYRLSENNSR
jgi:hypothetical protein